MNALQTQIAVALDTVSSKEYLVCILGLRRQRSLTFRHLVLQFVLRLSQLNQLLRLLALNVQTKAAQVETN